MCLLSFEEWRQDNNSTCLIHFCEAIENVKKNYYGTEYRKRNGNGNIIKMQYLERVFAYELYHQFRIKTEEPPEYADLRLDAELVKYNWNGEYNDFGIAIDHIPSYFSPDLVLHHSQNERQHNQKLIVEIKSTKKRPKEKQKDIVKLINYVINLHFESAVFLLFGKKDNLKSLEVFTRLLPEHEQNFGNIFIVNSYFEGDNQIIKINSLKNVLEGGAVAGG
jgi:hypothetical protein